MVRSLIVVSLLLISSFSSAQFSRSKSWSYNLTIGASNMFSDLGGGPLQAHNDFRDFDLRATRPALGVGLTRHHKNLSLGLNLIATQLVAKDQYTTNRGRSYRNLSANTDLVEISLVSEAYPFARSPRLNRFFVSGGVSAAYFKPKAKLGDNWIALRPLGTEGQLFEGGEQPYNRFVVAVPLGVGYGLPLNRISNLKFHLGYRITYTDYLNDVSTTYVDAAQLAESGGANAATLADRSTSGMVAGTKRGNPSNNDHYVIATVTYQRTIGAKKYDDCTNFEIPLRKTGRR